MHEEAGTVNPLVTGQTSYAKRSSVSAEDTEGVPGIKCVTPIRPFDLKMQRSRLSSHRRKSLFRFDQLNLRNVRNVYHVPFSKPFNQIPIGSNFAELPNERFYQRKVIKRL